MPGRTEIPSSQARSDLPISPPKAAGSKMPKLKSSRIHDHARRADGEMHQTLMVSSRACKSARHMQGNFLIIEDDLRKALRLAEVVERKGGAIIGTTSDESSALAIAEGESADFAVLDDGVPPDDQRRQTAEMLFTHLGIPTLAITAGGKARLLRNTSSRRLLALRLQGDRRWHLGRIGKGF